MNFLQKFWNWYEKNLTFNTAIAAGLFTLQLVHLYWLSTAVVAQKVFGQSFFELFGIWQILILLVDYTEIPAILTTSFVYINDIRKGSIIRGLLFLFFINSQWLHIFWITDEFVIEQFTAKEGTILPLWLAYLAIAIDYLELPVIFDTIRKFLLQIREKLSFLTL